MKTGLDHLPAGKRRELEFVVEILREGFTEAISRRTVPRFRNGRLLKIVLFGSYARGDWVDDPIGRYFSDYDLLVVVDHDDLTDVPEFWAGTEARLLDELSLGQRLRTPVSVIHHSLDDVNEQLRLGRYFFLDILRDGVGLYEEPGHPFETPQALSPSEALTEARQHFEEWFESGQQFYQQYTHAVADDAPKIAAFDLHQATERFYHCLFLVRTLYSPKTHRLSRLRKMCEEIEPALGEVWPGSNKFERRCFQLLDSAYVKARYSRHYKITPEELDWLSQRIDRLQTLVRASCEERLASLGQAAPPKA